MRGSFPISGYKRRGEVTFEFAGMLLVGLLALWFLLPVLKVLIAVLSFLLPVLPFVAIGLAILWAVSN